MSQDVSIDYDAVEAMAQGFDTSADVMKSVANALEIAINILKISALLGNIGAAAMARYLEGIKPNLERLAATCEEMSGDLNSAVAYYRDGDTEASQKFVV
ncbi:MAG: type VII secretion target [Aggregatilineales bacterium]